MGSFWWSGAEAPATFPAPLRTVVRQRVGHSSGRNPGYHSGGSQPPARLLFGGGSPHLMSRVGVTGRGTGVIVPMFPLFSRFGWGRVNSVAGTASPLAGFLNRT